MSKPTPKKNPFDTSNEEEEIAGVDSPGTHNASFETWAVLYADGSFIMGFPSTFFLEVLKGSNKANFSRSCSQVFP